MKKTVMIAVLASLGLAPLYAQAEATPADPAAQVEQPGDSKSESRKLAREARKAEALKKYSAEVQAELKAYKEARKALYDKLSPDAKQALKDVRHAVRKGHKKSEKPSTTTQEPAAPNKAAE